MSGNDAGSFLVLLCYLSCFGLSDIKLIYLIYTNKTIDCDVCLCGTAHARHRTAQ